MGPDDLDGMMDDVLLLAFDDPVEKRATMGMTSHPYFKIVISHNLYLKIHI